MKNKEELLDRLISKKDRENLSAYDIASKAHYRWDRNQHINAALLFELAEERADQEFSTGKAEVNQKMNYRARVAVNYFKAGEIDIAIPMFVEVCNYDWTGNGLVNDDHMVEWGFVYRLYTVKDKAAKFRKLFAEAQKRSNDINKEFPKIHPLQEQLLEYALQLNETDIVIHLVKMIKKRRPISRAFRAKLKIIEATFNLK